MKSLKTALAWGLSFSLVYVLFVLAVFLARGPEAFEQAGTTLPRVAAAYVASGFVGGVLFGLLMPLGRTRAGAALLGLIVAIPVAHIVMLAVDSAALYGAPRPVVTIGTALILGPLCGVAMWYVNHRF